MGNRTSAAVDPFPDAQGTAHSSNQTNGSESLDRGAVDDVVEDGDPQLDLTNLLVVDPNVYYSVEENGNILVHSMVAYSQNDDSNSSQFNSTRSAMDENMDADNILVLYPDTYYSVEENGNVATDKVEEPSTEQPRWSYGKVPTKGELKGFDVPPVVTEVVSKRKDRNAKRGRKPRKEQSEELTSSPYRKKLLKDNAAKEIKIIKKKNVTRKCRQRKTAGLTTMDDILCSYCGVVFSSSDNGEGWMMCVQCKTWFHTKYATDPDSITCEMCA